MGSVHCGRRCRRSRGPHAHRHARTAPRRRGAVHKLRNPDADWTAAHAHVSAYAYAILVSAYAFAKAVSSPYVGDLSDRFGRRRVLVATLVCTGLALLLCGRAERFATVLVVRLLTGCVANGGLLTARATDVATTHAQRTHE